MVATLDTASTKLKVEVLPTAELLELSRKRTLRTLSRLVNDTFAAHGHPNDNGDTVPGALFTKKRLVYDEEFGERMGPRALTAICTDETLLDETDVEAGTAVNHARVGKYGKIVATGSVCPWKGRTVDLVRSVREAMNAQAKSNAKIPDVPEHQLAKVGQVLAKDAAPQLPDSWNWEIKICSSSDDPRYRGRGLMIKCVDALLAELKSQQATMRASGDSAGDLPIKLWITSLDGTGNTEYWLRRGFTRVGEAEVAPPGTWTSTREISLSTLCKVVE